MRGQVGRMAPRGDRLDDIGGEEGERQEAAEVPIADPFDPGEFGNAAGLTRDECLETAMRPPELLQQDRIGFCRSGRGPLDVLLSFAQFEREVAGERIRDKIAASKQKGMWMGGMPPLGYAVRDHKLVIVPGEADTVRHIFRRYRALGSVRLLRDELQIQGIRSQQLSTGTEISAEVGG